jgi:phage tail sheath protein FI
VPIALTYPGVYVEEVQSSVHTIVGVPTSVAAFVGYAARGPVDTAVQANSWADYERKFGGLDPSSPLSYAVFLFFLNGGNVAQIVRAGATDGSAAATKIALSDDVILVADSPGAWGDKLQLVVDTSNVRDPKTQFNLTITDGGSGSVERYTNLVLGGGPPGIPIATALASSQLMSVNQGSGLTKLPSAGTYTTGTFTKPADSAGAVAQPAAGNSGGGAKAADQAPAGGSAGVDVAADKLAVPGDPAAKTGIYALAKVDIFNMLCLPSAADKTYAADVLSEATAFCKQQRAMLIVDPPATWSTDPAGSVADGQPPPAAPDPLPAPAPLTFPGVVRWPAVTSDQDYAAVYYPNLVVADPVTGANLTQGPCGAVAGVWASTDDARGIWKAPAGTAAGIAGISDLAVHIDDGESGVLNPIAVNCLRTLPLVGPVSWGARTAAGLDEMPSQWKYIPVRRTALFIEESVRRGTQWAVFEPNDEPLWSSIRLNIGAFMNSLFKQGAFQGSKPADAYLVQCDADNNPQSSINQGILNILVGFQPLVPAEFVIIQIEQLVGQLQG